MLIGFGLSAGTAIPANVHAQGGDADGSAKPAPVTVTTDEDEAERAPAGVYVHDLLEAVPAAGSAISALTVDNRLGDVKIVGHDGIGLSIFAIKHAPNAQTLERLEVKLIQDPRGPVSIRTQLNAGHGETTLKKGAARIDLVVRVPRTAHVTATVWNGKLRIRKVSNGANVSANEGPIHLKNVSGLITSNSAAGQQRFEQISGELESRILDGDVDVDGMRGKRLSASVKSGQVTARGVRVTDLMIRVVKGDIRLEAEVIAGGSYVVASINGNVHASVRGSSRVKVHAQAKRGELSLPKRLRPNDSSVSDVVGYLGEGSRPAHLSLRSGTGNVVLAKF